MRLLGGRLDGVGHRSEATLEEVAITTGVDALEDSGAT